MDDLLCEIPKHNEMVPIASRTKTFITLSQILQKAYKDRATTNTFDCVLAAGFFFKNVSDHHGDHLLSHLCCAWCGLQVELPFVGGEPDHLHAGELLKEPLSFHASCSPKCSWVLRNMNSNDIVEALLQAMKRSESLIQCQIKSPLQFGIFKL